MRRKPFGKLLPSAHAVDREFKVIAALGKWLEANVEGFTPPFELVKFPSGQSNPTYKISAVSGDYVLRRASGG